MEATPQQLLQRFCYLGSLEPIYVHQSTDIDVEKYYKHMQGLLKNLDDVAFTALIKPILLDTSLPRRDEVLFVLAMFYETEMKPTCKSNVVKVFPKLITSDDDLFLFCKQASLIKGYQKRNGFSKTVRKSVVLWYEAQGRETLLEMWTKKRGANGFSHRLLVQLFHISDAKLFGEDINKKEIDQMYFKGCKEVVVENEETAAKKLKIEEKNEDKDTQESGTEETKKQPAVNGTDTAESSPLIIAIAKLRTTLEKNEALNIIRTHKLCYEQVPFRLLRYTSIVEEILPRMSYIQILEFWRYIVRYNHYMHPSIQRLCTRLMGDTALLKKSNIPPVRILMLIDALGAKFLSSELKFKKVLNGKMPSLRQIYKTSYGNDTERGYRMHITLNLQTFYKNKFLKNHRKLTYFEAAISLAFGFFKRERNCSAYYWLPSKWELSQIAWTPLMEIDDALDCCKEIKNYKNPQQLFTPINHALQEKSRVYDVFLAIIPKNGRGNPGQCSDTLYKTLERYREKCNPKAKFIIVNLLKFKKSMSYNCARNEHILEICGLDANTVNLIDSFVQERFY